MKKKFILLAMMLLTLIGGVNLNVLNAQETITIGESGTYTTNFMPGQTNYNYALSQQIYLSDELNGLEGEITHIAFKSAKTNDNRTRVLQVYMTNTDKSKFEEKAFVAMDKEVDLVFEGDVVLQPKDSWLEITLDSPFRYESGKNILLAVNDITSLTNPNQWFISTYYAYGTSEERGLYVYLDSNSPFDVSSPSVPNNFSYASGYPANNVIRFTYEAAGDDIVPAAPTNLAVAECTHNSVSLTWDAAENAKKYNVHVYNNGVEITGSPFTSTGTAYTVEGLDAETTYTFKVQSVRGDNLSENFSNEVSATTLEAPKTRNIVFVLTDSYGDGWNGNTLQVYLNDVLTHTLSNENLDGSYQQEEEQTKILSIIEGTEVKVVYNYPGGNTYPSENSFEIYYEDGTLINGQDKITGNGTASTFVVVTFTVELSVPKVTIEASEESIYLDETATLTATAANFEGDVTYSWSPVENLSDAAISNPVFTPTTTGIFEFTCTATDAQNNEASETITINVTERPALSLTVNANKTQIYAGHYATLQALVIGGFDPYTYSWSLGGQVVETADTYSFSASEPGEYTITCKVTDDKGEEVEKAETITVIPDPFVGKQFRIKVVNGTYANYYLNINTNKVPGTYDYSSWTYITESQVGVAVESDYDGQKFTIENDGDGHYYLKSADGYYIKCDYRNQTYNGNWWSVYAYSNSEKTPLVFEYVGENFYIRDYDKMTNNSVSGGNDTYTPNNSYFKVNSNSLVYCDAAISVPEVVLWTVEEILPKPENLVATPAQIYAGDVTTLTWNEFDGAASYNVYVNSELNGSTTGTSYELSGLAYNMNPGHKIEVVALNENGDVISGKASVTVQVAGTFTLTVNVTDDGTNPIIGATVNVTTDEWTYDEFGYNIASLSSLLTDENGQAVFNNVKLLNPDTYCAYSISATMDVYGTHSTTPLANYESVANGGNVTRTIVMTLPEPKNITADKELYIAGEDVVLTWETPEFNTRAFLGYNVYSVIDGDYDLGTETSYTKLNEETLTETTYTIENVEYGAKFAVSAVYDEGESSKVNANVQITAYTNLVVNVKDANTLAGIDGAVVEIYSYRTGETETFVTANGGIVEEEYLLGNYTVTVKKNDSHYEVEPQEAQLVYGDGAELEFELTPKASIENVTVTADNTGYVRWTGDYAKWNVYRRNTNAPQELTLVATELEATNTTDAAWETLEPGTYQYGVAALVEPQAQTRGTEPDFTEDFEDGNSEGWTHASNWYITTKNDSKVLHIMAGTEGLNRPITSPEIKLSEGTSTLKFDYLNDNNYYPAYGEDYNRYNTIVVKIVEPANEDGKWNTLETFETYNERVNGSLTSVELSLGNNYSGQPIYIQFDVTCVYGGITEFDNIIVTTSSPAIETQIVWSNEVEKKAPVMFYAYEDTEWNNPNNWNVKRLPTAEDEVVILTSVNISSEANANSLNIASDGTVTVDENGVLNVAASITNNGSLVLNDGGQIFQNNANIYAKFNMGIEIPTSWSEETSSKDGWQFISSPFNAAQISLFTGLFVPRSYDLYKYDGTQDLEWINHKSETEFEETFVNGRGYLASYETLTSVELAGYLYYAKSFTWDNLTHAEKDLANFHLLGNPFTFDMDMTAATYNNLVEGVAIVNNQGGYTYDVTTIPVGDGFFVKATGENPTLSYDAEAKATRGVKANSLNVIATGNAGKDNVIINLAGKSEGFDKLQNFNDAIATVYVAEDGKNYGIYNCDADVQEVELSFNANQMGNYTISIEPNGKFQTVTLVDRFTGIETNMLVEDYHFTAMSNVNTNRFIVRMVNGQESTDDSHFVYQSGEDLIIDAEGTVQIIDVMGRVLVSDEVESTNNRINVSGFQNGTYMVRVINGSEVKVEKVVIY